MGSTRWWTRADGKQCAVEGGEWSPRVELEGHVDAQKVVGGIACGLNLIIGQRSIERLIGIVAELGKIYGLGQRGKLELGILNDMLAVEFFVGARLLPTPTPPSPASTSRSPTLRLPPPRSIRHGSTISSP